MSLCCGVCQKPLRVTWKHDEFGFPEFPMYELDCSCDPKTIMFNRINRQKVDDYVRRESL